MDKRGLFFLEIGTEELPSRFFDLIINILKDQFFKFLKNYKLDYDNINFTISPRRIVVVIENLQLSQADKVLEVKGPAKEVAFDTSGLPTKALYGFLKSKKCEEKDIILKEVKGKEYVFVKQLVKGQDTKILLEKELVNMLKKIKVAKMMKWAKGNNLFIRPIHWLAALLDGKVLSVKFNEVKAKSFVYGHRFLSLQPVDVSNVKSYQDYKQLLKKHFVIVDRKERKDLVLKQVSDLAKSVNANLNLDNQLLQEVSDIVEYPTAFLGNFNPKYLFLPKEVLIMVMKKHQKYFPLFDENLNLLSMFIGVRNGNSMYIDIVKKGNEKVLNARFNDALFFYNEDKKIGLEKRVDQLQNVLFYKNLGTMYEKIPRIRELSLFILDKLNIEDIDIKHKLTRAVYLCKADLATYMVFEFPELQGIMGEIYAKAQGEDESIARAIRQHYLPTYRGDSLPDNLIASIIGIADRVDSLVGYFSMGILPKATGDAFGLRRFAFGLLEVLVEKEISLDIYQLIEESIKLYSDFELKKDHIFVKTKLIEFLNQRFDKLMQEKGYRYDIVRAVLESNLKNYNYFLKFKLIKYITNMLENRKEDFVFIYNNVVRIFNLLVKQENTSNIIDTNLFLKDYEYKLYNFYKQNKDLFFEYYLNGNLDNLFNLFYDASKLITQFFDNVLVISSDEKVKNNRLSLIKLYNELFLSIIKFKEIVI